MKTKILTKLISVVCAAAISTSCVFMSVGAAPAVIVQADWKQGFYKATELRNLVHIVEDNGFSFDDCADLANELKEFFSEQICTAAVFNSDSTYKEAFEENINYTLNKLRSPDEEQRKEGATAAIDNLYAVSDLIEEHIN